MKNTLQENMRRFGTKNLSEQTANPDPITLTPAQQMVQWATQFIKQHGFKLDSVESGPNEKVYMHRNIRGVVAIAIATLASLPISERTRMGAAGFEFVKANHSFALLAKRLALVLDDVSPATK